MEPEKYFNLFKKYTNGKINIHGIYLIPIEINDNYEIYYDLHNPDKKSYSKTSLTGWLNEIRQKFHDALGLDFVENLNYLDVENFYLSKDLLDKLSNYLNNVKVIKVGSIEIHVEHLYFTYGIRRDDSFVVTNYVKPIKSFIETKENKKRSIEMDFAIERYKNAQELSKYDETELSYPKFDEIIDENPALVDNDWMVQYVITEFDLNS